MLRIKFLRGRKPGKKVAIKKITKQMSKTLKILGFMALASAVVLPFSASAAHVVNYYRNTMNTISVTGVVQTETPGFLTLLGDNGATYSVQTTGAVFYDRFGNVSTVNAVDPSDRVTVSGSMAYYTGYYNNNTIYATSITELSSPYYHNYPYTIY